MLSRVNLFSLTLFGILSFEGYQALQVNDLENKVNAYFAAEDTAIKHSDSLYANLKKSIADKNANEKENLQIAYLKKITTMPNSSTIYDYSTASLVLSELLYSEKYLNLQQRFDSKNLLDVSEDTLSDNEKKYKELLVLHNNFDEQFKNKLTAYQKNEVTNYFKEYNSLHAYSKKWSLSKFTALNKKYDQNVEKYKIQYLISSPDYFDQVVEHFKENKSFSKKDYYSILSSTGVYKK